MEFRVEREETKRLSGQDEGAEERVSGSEREREDKGKVERKREKKERRKQQEKRGVPQACALLLRLRGPTPAEGQRPRRTAQCREAAGRAEGASWKERG